MKYYILHYELDGQKCHSFKKSIVTIAIFLLCTIFQSCITLTAKRQKISFTSSPSGAAVYRMYDKGYQEVDGINNYYIGTTPFTYEAKGSGDAFAFVKDGFYSQIIPAKKKGRWLAFLLGNWCFGPLGYIVDLNKIYAYKQDSFNAKLIERPHPIADPSYPVGTQTAVTPSFAMPKSFEISNAKSIVKPGVLPTQQRNKLTGSQTFKKYKDAVFMIFAGNNSSTAQGSGFIINNSGLSISNYHNFKGMIAVGVKMFGNKEFYEIPKENIIAYDEIEDYIIFKLPKEILSNMGKNGFAYIPVAKNVSEVGDKVYAIGSPQGLENTLSSGEISALRDLPYSIQINAPIDHGSSGGALINEYGEAVGITRAGRDDSGANLNFAIDLIRVLKKYK